MKAYYFERFVGGSNWHNNNHVRGIYLSQHYGILYREQKGTFGNFTYSIETKPELIEEVRKAVTENRFPIDENISYGNIKTFECDGFVVKELIDLALAEAELRKKTVAGIESLFQVVKTQ